MKKWGIKFAQKAKHSVNRKAKVTNKSRCINLRLEETNYNTRPDKVESLLNGKVIDGRLAVNKLSGEAEEVHQWVVSFDWSSFVVNKLVGKPTQDDEQKHAHALSATLSTKHFESKTSNALEFHFAKVFRVIWNWLKIISTFKFNGLS